MANNIVIGPNSRLAIVSLDFLSMGLNVNNCEIVYEVEGNYKSWKPGRLINAINSTTSGKGYIIEAKLNMDLTPYFAPPIETVSFKYVTPIDGIINI